MARLVLEDGKIFHGKSFGAQEASFGEIVFNTGMTGYQEIITDPSYAKQIITLTYPEIGNYGCCDEDIESAIYWSKDSKARASFAAGLVIKNYSPVASNFRSQETLDAFLRRQQIPAIHSINTRELTKHLRDKGAMRAILSPDSDKRSDEELVQAVQNSEKMEGCDLASYVSCSQKYQAKSSDKTISNSGSKYKVVAMDFGIKQNILNLLIKFGCEVTVVPAATSAKEILDMDADGIFLSNGPGDPAAVSYAVETIKELEQKFPGPIFGICLGHQLLALANQAKSYKLKFGHRGSNQPIKRLSDGIIEIASHNHGFAIAVEELPENLEITHLNINDDTVAGIRIKNKERFSVQYHPEASPGPHDSDYLFEQFTEAMAKAKCLT